MKVCFGSEALEQENRSLGIYAMYIDTYRDTSILYDPKQDIENPRVREFFLLWMIIVSSQILRGMFLTYQDHY